MQDFMLHRKPLDPLKYEISESDKLISGNGIHPLHSVAEFHKKEIINSNIIVDKINGLG